MTTINLKDFYYWYTQDQLIEVSDEVAEVFLADALNTPSRMVPSGRSNGAHRTGKWCRLTAWMVHGHTASV